MQGMLVKENDRYLFGGLVTALLRYVITFLIYFDISFSFERKRKKSPFTPRRKEITKYSNGHALTIDCLISTRNLCMNLTVGTVMAALPISVSSGFYNMPLFTSITENNY